jgi:hypothetical protein
MIFKNAVHKDEKRKAEKAETKKPSNIFLHGIVRVCAVQGSRRSRVFVSVYSVQKDF